MSQNVAKTAEKVVGLTGQYRNSELQRVTLEPPAALLRLVLPPVPREIFLDGIMELVKLDRGWVPPSEVGSLYIRLILYGTDENISARPASSCQFVVFTCPVGPYYPDAVDLLVSTDYARAFPGGTGDVKPAGNYAAAMLATQKAQEAGYHNVLWLDARDRPVTSKSAAL